MNRILFEQQADTYSLSQEDPRFEHIRGVLRMRVGDSFDAGVVNGPVGKATLSSLEDGLMEVRVEWGDRPPPPPPVTLVVGLCRPATVRKILATAPTLGVWAILFPVTARTDPAYPKASLWSTGEWRARLLEGVEQAFDTYLPPVMVPGSLAEAVDKLPPDCLRLALDVYEGTAPLGAIRPAPGQPVCLAVGPERGWDEKDRFVLGQAGFQLVSLNTRVLRVETAVTVGLALLLSAMGVY